MRSLHFILLMWLISACSNLSAKPNVNDFNGEIALEYVSEQMAFGPREPGTLAHSLTGDWIKKKMLDLGWLIEEQPFYDGDLLLKNYIATNPAASTGPPILLGAHYDTRPISDRDAAQTESPVPGANDGASGVAVLIELARVIRESRIENPIWLVFFDAEDSGGFEGRDWDLGSHYFAENMRVRPVAVVIVDMIGDRDLEIYFERNSTDELKTDIWAIANNLGVDSFIPEERFTIIDDHIPFLNLGIPSALIIDFDYPYWHTTQDTIDKVSAESLEKVGMTLAAWLSIKR